MTGEVAAFIGSEHDEAAAGDVAQINVSGPVNVTANADMESVASVERSGLSGFSITIMAPTAEVTGAVRSYIGENSDVHASGVNVRVHEDTIMEARTEADYFGIGLISGAGTKSLSTVSGVIEAFIGAGISRALAQDIYDAFREIG